MCGELERTAAGDVALTPAPDALRPGSGIGQGTPVGGLAKDAVRPGSVRWDAKHGKLLRGGIGEGNGEERSEARGYVVGHRTSGDCAATVSVRSAVAARPEQGEPAVPLPVSRSYAAIMGKQPELVVRSNRRV